MCISVIELVCENCRAKIEIGNSLTDNVRDEEKAYAQWLKALCERCKQTVKNEGYLAIWDCCFKCGKDLTVDMIEDEDWFDVHNCGEAFPLCSSCYHTG